jgi:hypothetical protein
MSMQRWLVPIVFAMTLLCSPRAAATAQEPDYIVLDGERLQLETNVLRPMLQSGAIKLPKPDAQWTSNWRGYVATYEVRDGVLLLTSISVLRDPPGKTGKDVEAVPTEVLPDVFGGKHEAPAIWFSGTLVLPRGEVVDYVHMGYGSTHERYTILTVKHGHIARRKDLDAKAYDALRKVKFAQFRQTAAYATQVQDMRKDGGSRKYADDFLYDFAVEEYMSLGDP